MYKSKEEIKIEIIFLSVPHITKYNIYVLCLVFPHLGNHCQLLLKGRKRQTLLVLCGTPRNGTQLSMMLYTPNLTYMGKTQR